MKRKNTNKSAIPSTPLLKHISHWGCWNHELLKATQKTFTKCTVWLRWLLKVKAQKKNLRNKYIQTPHLKKHTLPL